MYLGAKYLGKQSITVGKSGTIYKQGDICPLPEREAIGRPEFEPVYSETKKETKNDKKLKESIKELEED